jgi:ABC-type branched-subunit amino acid transport system ATPase component
MPLLHVTDMSHNFGGLQAVSKYNLSLDPGQITGLIGPNGAGKTTIFNLITGIYRPTRRDRFGSTVRNSSVRNPTRPPPWGWPAPSRR